jgi:hypothetical protein
MDLRIFPWQDQPVCSQASSGVPSWALRILSSCGIGLVSYMEQFCDSGSDPPQMPNTLQYYESSTANPRLVAGWRDQNGWNYQGLDVWGLQFRRAAVRVSGKTWQPKIQKILKIRTANAWRALSYGNRYILIWILIITLYDTWWYTWYFNPAYSRYMKSDEINQVPLVVADFNGQCLWSGMKLAGVNRQKPDFEWEMW